MRVGEGGEDTAAAEVDDLRARERGLVDADAAGDVGAGDRERTCDRQLRIHRPDDPVLENHGAEPSPYRAPLPRHATDPDRLRGAVGRRPERLIAMSVNQAGPGDLAGFSRTIVVRRP